MTITTEPKKLKDLLTDLNVKTERMVSAMQDLSDVVTALTGHMLYVDIQLRPPTEVKTNTLR